MPELALARSACRASQTLAFFADPAEGHDDYLMSLVLCLDAANSYTPRIATATPQGMLL